MGTGTIKSQKVCCNLPPQKPPRQSLSGLCMLKYLAMNRKDFSLWHTRKTFVHNEKQRPFFSEREVWFCAMGENVGYEQDGRGENFLRPVLILIMGTGTIKF